MASPGLFTSAQAIRSWFAAKMAPLEIQTYALQRCTDCTPSINPCPTCQRKHEIIAQDLETLKQLESREIELFKHEKQYGFPVFQQLYEKELAKIKGEMEGLEEIDTLAKHFEHSEIGGLAKTETQEEQIEEKGIEGQEKGAVVLEMGVDVIEERFDALEKGVVDLEKEVVILEKEVDVLADGVGAVGMEWDKLVEKLEDLDRWFEMEDDIMKAKGWI